MSVTLKKKISITIIGALFLESCLVIINIIFLHRGSDGSCCFASLACFKILISSIFLVYFLFWDEDLRNV